MVIDYKFDMILTEFKKMIFELFYKKGYTSTYSKVLTIKTTLMTINPQ